MQKSDQIRHSNLLKQIPNIPSIKSVYCVTNSSYLIDFEGNLWSFGNNKNGQLAHGDTANRNVPTKIECLKDITEISRGCRGNHFLAKDSQNTIFATGNNSHGQLGVGIPKESTSPTELDSKYFIIWGDNINRSKCKSARKF